MHPKNSSYTEQTGYNFSCYEIILYINLATENRSCDVQRSVAMKHWIGRAHLVRSLCLERVPQNVKYVLNHLGGR